jgi:hypothetical protein
LSYFLFLFSCLSLLHKPHIVAIPHDNVYILYIYIFFIYFLRNSFLYIHCNTFLCVCWIQLSVSYNGCTHDAAVGIELFSHLWRNDLTKCVLLVNVI